MKPLVVILAVAACGSPPPFQIEYAVTTGSAQACYADPQTGAIATSCSDISMLCPADLSVRVFSPSSPSTPYISLCEKVTDIDSHMNLCSITGLALPPPVAPIPEETLEVDVAVYPDSELPHDTSNNPICPTNIVYGADGAPMDVQPTTNDPWPAIGGQAFYHAGDADTVVTLYCTNLDRLQDVTCIGSDNVDVTATVDDFATDLPVSATLAQSLNVWVGEPVSSAGQYVLPPVDTQLLQLTDPQPVPGWDDVVQLDLVATACLEVLENAPETTPTLSCTSVTPNQQIVDLVGVRLATPTLAGILTALNQTSFPDAGIVVGEVLDDLGNPAPNVTVTATSGSTQPTIQYYSAGETTFTSGATATTSSNGIFVSLDAPYGTTFSVPGSVQTAPTPQLGGIVEGKVTIVVLQFKQGGST